MSSVHSNPHSAASRWPTRGADMLRLLDTFLICAVLTILVIRTELYLTNYPQIGGHGLHIAHLLWGGLGMLVAQIMLLSFVTPAVRQVAAVVGGIGFGLFMDEVGKFVTSDNNYFFKPTAAIIYCVFITIFLVVRQLDRGWAFSPREYLLNAIELTKDVPLLRLGRERRRHALALLDRADPADPLVPHVRAMLDDPRALDERPAWPGRRLVRRIRRELLERAEHPGFEKLTVALIAVWVTLLVTQIVIVVWFTGTHLHRQQPFRLGGRITSVSLDSEDRAFVIWAVTLSTAVAAAFAVTGLVQLVRGLRRQAFEMLERALLVSIFFTQVFAFVHTQFEAVIGLLVDLVLFLMVRTVLTREIERRPPRKVARSTDAAPPA
jgi:hypothetical protein